MARCAAVVWTCVLPPIHGTIIALFQWTTIPSAQRP